MSRPRIVVPVVLVVAAVAAAGVAAATRHSQSTQAAAASFNAGSVTRSHMQTCTASDGVYQFTTATYSGMATSSDARLNGPIEIRVGSVVNTTTKLGFLDGTLRIRGAGSGANGNVHGAIANGSFIGTVVGRANGSSAKLVASLAAGFSPTTGFANGALGTGAANGAGVLFARGDCRRPRPEPSTAIFRVHLTPGEVVPRVKDLHADAFGNLTLDLTRDASSAITSGNVAFDVNYRFPGSVTITGLALHQGNHGTNGPVVLSAGVGTFTDPDGHGNLTKVVSGASPALLQGLLQNPRGYYVDLTTAANSGGALRDQLNSPDRH